MHKHTYTHTCMHFFMYLYTHTPHYLHIHVKSRCEILVFVSKMLLVQIFLWVPGKLGKLSPKVRSHPLLTVPPAKGSFS